MTFSFCGATSKKKGRFLADQGHDGAVAVFAAFDNDSFGQAEPFPQSLFAFGVYSGWHYDRRAHDPFLPRPFSISGERLLRKNEDA
ncbi:MAG: hypothetical protein OXN84_08565 [Albidovulum sp.]|nr:hypothetical protein [Albidovulum sp.]